MTMRVSAPPSPWLSRNSSNEWRLSEQSVKAADCATMRESSEGGSIMQANGRLSSFIANSAAGVKGRSPPRIPSRSWIRSASSGRSNRRCTSFQSSRHTVRSASAGPPTVAKWAATSGE